MNRFLTRSREDAKGNKHDRMHWTKNSNNNISIMVWILFHLNFAASRLRVKQYFVPSSKRVQEKKIEVLQHGIAESLLLSPLKS